MLEWVRARMGGRAPAPPDLGDADLTQFRMLFPARVTLETTDGETLSASQQVPFGAPGQTGYLETVEEKFRTEAGVLLPPDQVEAALDQVCALEDTALDDLSSSLCRKNC